MRFLKKFEVYISVVDPSEDGPAFYRLVEASGADGKALNVKVINRIVLKGVKTFANAKRQA